MCVPPGDGTEAQEEAATRTTSTLSRTIRTSRTFSRTLRVFLTISLKVGFLVFLEILVLRLEVLCGSGSR